MTSIITNAPTYGYFHPYDEIHGTDGGAYYFRIWIYVGDPSLVSKWETWERKSDIFCCYKEDPEHV